MDANRLKQLQLEELGTETMQSTNGGILPVILAAITIYAGVRAIAYGVGYVVGSIEEMIEENQGS